MLSEEKLTHLINSLQAIHAELLSVLVQLREMKAEAHQEAKGRRQR